MIEKIIIENIEVKSGTSKSGRGYSLVIVEAVDGRKMSMYVDKEFDLKAKRLEKVQGWQTGKEVQVKTEQNGDYLNFEVPSKHDLLEAKVESLEERLDLLETAIINAQNKKAQKAKN
jgi:hypothetical protein